MSQKDLTDLSNLADLSNNELLHRILSELSKINAKIDSLEVNGGTRKPKTESTRRAPKKKVGETPENNEDKIADSDDDAAKTDKVEDKAENEENEDSEEEKNTDEKAKKKRTIKRTPKKKNVEEPEEDGEKKAEKKELNKLQYFTLEFNKSHDFVKQFLTEKEQQKLLEDVNKVDKSDLKAYNKNKFAVYYKYISGNKELDAKLVQMRTEYNKK